jgi:hypothetical protein
MSAAGVTAKLPSPLDSAELSPPLDRHAPPTPPNRAELPPPRERHEPPIPADHHGPPSLLDRAELPPPRERHEPPIPADHHRPPSLLDRDLAQEAMLRSIDPVAAAWAAQEAELDAEIAALEAAGAVTAPAEEEQPGPDLDPDIVPPYGLRPWLADLSGSPFDECLAATADATGPEMPHTGCRDRVRNRALGFAAGGDADLSPPGAALAGLAEAARAAGLSG